MYCVNLQGSYRTSSPIPSEFFRTFHNLESEIHGGSNVNTSCNKDRLLSFNNNCLHLFIVNDGPLNTLQKKNYARMTKNRYGYRVTGQSFSTIPISVARPMLRVALGDLSIARSLITEPIRLIIDNTIKSETVESVYDLISLSSRESFLRVCDQKYIPTIFL